METAEEFEKRLENAIKCNPDRYIPERDENGKLVSVVDADTSRVHFRTKEGWMWIE